MHIKHTGIAKVLAFCLPLAMSFSLIACGDDSSSTGAGGSEKSSGKTADADDDGDSNGRPKATCSLPDDGDEWVIDVINDDEATSAHGDEIIHWVNGKAVVMKKKKMGNASTCQSMVDQGGLSGTCDEDGNLLMTLTSEKYKDFSKKELSKAIKENWYNCVSASETSSSSGKVNSSDSKSANPFEGMEVGKCNFKIEDKVWKYVTYSDMLGDEYTAHFYEYKEDGSQDSTHTISLGSMAKSLCGFGKKDTTYTEDDITYRYKNWCTDEGSEDFQVQKGIDADYTREEAFDDFMDECKLFNDIFGDDDDDDDDDGDAPPAVVELSSSSNTDDSSSSSKKVDSSSSKKDEKSSSSVGESEDESSSSVGESEDNEEDAVAECAFSKDDDEWVVSSMIRFVWEDDEVKAVTQTDMGDAATCAAVLEAMVAESEETNYSCDGAVLSIEDADSYAEYTRDDLFTTAQAMCGN